MRPHVLLFLHVVAAIALFGALAAVATIAFAARRRAEQAQLAQSAFGTLLVLALPAWVALLAFGSWTKSKEGLPGSLRWLQIGSGVTTAGVILLLVATGVAFSWTRRPDGDWQPLAVGVLATAYSGALAVAWWVMTTKLPT